MFGLTPLGDYLASRFIQNILAGLVNNIISQSYVQSMQLSGNFIGTEIRETPEEYILVANLPGVSRESINVKYMDNYLTLTANSDQYLQNEYGGYVRYMGNINRSFYFDDIDGEKVDGSFENGILKLILLKVKKHIKNE